MLVVLRNYAVAIAINGTHVPPIDCVAYRPYEAERRLVAGVSCSCAGPSTRGTGFEQGVDYAMLLCCYVLLHCINSLGVYT